MSTNPGPKRPQSDGSSPSGVGTSRHMSAPRVPGGLRLLRVTGYLVPVLQFMGPAAALLLYLSRWHSAFTVPGIVVGGAAAAYASAQPIYKGWIARELARRTIESLMDGIGNRLRTGDAATFGIRCSVMRFDGKVLRLVASPVGKGFFSTDERALRWRVGDRPEGACGIAAYRREIVKLDLSEWKGKPYEEILHEDDQPRWGVTQNQWAHTRDLGSVVSMPIIVQDQLLGVLNLDARVGLVDWLPDEQAEEALLGWLYGLRGTLAMLLELLR